MQCIYFNIQQNRDKEKRNILEYMLWAEHYPTSKYLITNFKFPFKSKYIKFSYSKLDILKSQTLK